MWFLMEEWLRNMEGEEVVWVVNMEYKVLMRGKE